MRTRSEHVGRTLLSDALLLALPILALAVTLPVQAQNSPHVVKYQGALNNVKYVYATVEPVALPLGMLIPEAAVFALAKNDQGELAASAGPELLRLSGRCDALVAGPGMGEGADAAEIATALPGGTPGVAPGAERDDPKQQPDE